MNNMKKETLKNILGKTLVGILILLIVVLIFISGNKAAQRWEQRECQEWKEQSIQYKDWNWFASGWQIEQCQHYGIQLN